jgi:exo-beta-1,3-glucanase (GH17 family)
MRDDCQRLPQPTSRLPLASRPERARGFALATLFALLVTGNTAAAAARAADKDEPEPACAASFSNTAAISRLADVMAHGRFVTYEPTSLKVTDGHSTEVDPASVRLDLKALRSRFDGLITYTPLHGADAIARIAASLGYRALVVGVWNPFDEVEVQAALAQARRYPKLVVGLSLGNEVVFASRHGLQELAAVIAAIRHEVPDLPLSTSEPFHIFDADTAKPLLGQLDFLLPIVHPVFQPWFRDAPDANAAQFVVNVVGNLGKRFCGPILVKEVGEPTAPAQKGYSEQRQAAFFSELQRVFPPQRMKAFAYFSAFDAPWRATDELAHPAAQSKPGGQPSQVQGPHVEEAHWGLYDEHRSPKRATLGILPLN